LAEYIINLLVHIGLVTNTFLWPTRYNDDTFVISNIRQTRKYNNITWTWRHATVPGYISDGTQMNERNRNIRHNSSQTL